MVLVVVVVEWTCLAACVSMSQGQERASKPRENPGIIQGVRKSHRKFISSTASVSRSFSVWGRDEVPS